MDVFEELDSSDFFSDCPQWPLEVLQQEKWSKLRMLHGLINAEVLNFVGVWTVVAKGYH